MAEQQIILAAYNSALAEATRVIRNQLQFISSATYVEYNTRISQVNQKILDFIDAWGVAIRVEFYVETSTNGRQEPGQRFVTLPPYELRQSRRFTPTEFRRFIRSLPHVPRDSLGDDPKDHECTICYNPFFEARGRPEAETIGNGSVARPDMSQQLHEVPGSEMPEFPVRLPCGHIFGRFCIQVWIAGEESGDPPTCPICRAIWRPVGWELVPMGEVTIIV